MKIFQFVIFVFFFLPSISSAQEKYNFYLSNNGNDTLPGTSKILAKKTIAGLAPLLKNFSGASGGVKVGLKSGDTWEENLVTSYPIQLDTYNDNTNDKSFAILNGSKEFSSGWEKEPASGNTFRQAITYTGFVGYGINDIGSYSFIYVIEIDKTLEKTAPITARKLLKFVSVLSDVDRIAGSFYTPVNTNQNPIPVFIHTSDGNSPNANAKYRYEVTVRDYAVNSTYQENNHFENLWIRGFGAGFGMLPGGANSYYNKIIFGPGAAIHHLAVRSGTINHSLFLPGPKNTNEFAVVFYDVEGLGRHCTIKNSMFFDIKSPVYAHTSSGANYGAIEIDNVLAFADSTETSGFMYTSNCDSVILNKIYTDRYTAGYYYGNAKYASITNSWFKDVTFGIGYSPNNPVATSVKNVFVKTKGITYGSGIIMQSNTALILTNSIIHIVNKNKGANYSGAGSFIFGSGESKNKIDATGNIFICDIEPSKTLIAANTSTINGIGTSKDHWNNNVYILLRGNKLYWTANNDLTGGSYTIQNFTEWKTQSGQDQNSLFFDLREDPRGLKAIFTDPDNGNYELANTIEGNQVAALRAGMTSPITCFLQKPSYEAAADIILNSKTLSVNTCRNPCLQNSIRVNATFDLAVINTRQVRLQWNISEQLNIDHYEVQRSTGNSIFKRVGNINVAADSLYTFIDNLQPNIEYRYRLLIAPRTGGKCYSESRTAKITDNRPFSIFPNPSPGKVVISMNGYQGPTSFMITNSVGQVIMVKETLSMFSTLELDLTNQPKGVYFLKLKTDNGTTVQKFSLQ